MKIPIEEAVEVLDEHIKDVFTVEEWADWMGYDSSSYFSRKFRNYWGTVPSKKLVEQKIMLFKKIIGEAPSQLNYSIAQELGLPDDVALCRYIKRHTGKTITDFKNKKS
jgi:AraC-like DNA-binding protein